MHLSKKLFIIFLTILSTSLHANFSLTEVHSSSSVEPALSEEVSPVEEESRVLFSEDLNEPQEFSYWQEFFRMMLILGAILGGVLLLAWFLKGFLNKRIKQVNQQNQIKVLERRNLSQKSMIYLIEVEGKRMLISDSASGGVRLLMDCQDTEEMTHPLEAVKTKELASKFSFSQILQRKLTNKALKPFFNSKNIKTDYEIHEEN